MNELEIFDLYNKNMNKKTEEFVETVDSTLRVQTDYEKVTSDTEWIELMEQTIPYIDNILRNPNRFIINEEEIVKIELARKITVESIKHLSKNTNLIQDIDEDTGDVKPSKILNINKEESYDTYENRVIYTLIQNAKFFIRKKKEAIEQMGDTEEKNDKQLDYTGKSKVSDENINISIKLSTTLDTEGKKSDNSNEELLKKIGNIEQRITDLTSSEVYKIIDKKHITLVRPPIKKTNVILKNVNFQYAMKLWNFLQDNLDDELEEISEKKDYMDENDLKKLVDEIFLLNYLIINTLDKDKGDEEEDEENIEEKEIKEQLTDQMIENIVDINMDLTEEQLKEMVGNRYQVIKYRNLATINEIQKVFKEHIEKYLKKIN